MLETIANGGPWDTVSGSIDLKAHIREKQWGVGQWQNGQFVGVSPSDMAGPNPSSPSRRGEAGSGADSQSGPSGRGVFDARRLKCR